jgi:AcrR family transcriptional regulator
VVLPLSLMEGHTRPADELGVRSTPRPSTAAERRLSGAPRARILHATVLVLAERGFRDATVGLVLEAAGVSWHTFADMFDGLEDCVAAVLDQALRYATGLVADAFASVDVRGSWRDGLRAALAQTLAFMDAQPELARVTMVEALAGGPRVLARREEAREAFRALVVERIEHEVPHVWPLASEAMLASVMGMVHAHLVTRNPALLTALLAPLMATLTAPYSTPEELERELTHSHELARQTIAEHAATRGSANRHAGWAGPTVPSVLSNPRSRHARECLAYIAEHPDASNRQIAVGVGVAHTSQISSILSRLASERLLERHSEGAGRRNAWRLTEYGREVLQALRDQ